MKYYVELGKEDIVRLIAEKFDVSDRNVTLSIEKETVGYGPMEHDEDVVKVTVEGMCLFGGNFNL